MFRQAERLDAKRPCPPPFVSFISFRGIARRIVVGAWYGDTGHRCQTMYSGGSGGGGGSRRRPRDVWSSGSGDSGGRGHGDDKKDEDDRKPSASIPEGAEVIDLLDDDSDTDAGAGGDDGGDDTRKPSSQAHVSASPRRRNAASSPPPRSRRRRRDNRDHNHPTSLFAASSAGTSAASMSSNTTNTNISSSSNSNNASSSDDRGRQHWTCPTCTLHNPLTAALCEACGGLRSGLGVGGLGMQLGGGLRRRTPTPTGRFVGSVNRNGAGSSRSGRSDGSGVARRTNDGGAAAAAREEIVIDDTPPQQRRRTTHHQNNPSPSNPNNANSSPPSAYSYVGGGALLGGMLGATYAYLHGRPLGPAALEGAFAGGVGGAAVNVARSSSAGAAASSASYRRGGGTGGTATAAGGGGAGAYGRGYRVGGGAGGGAGAGHADAYLRHLQNELLRSMAGPPGYHGGRFGGGRYYYGHRAMAPDIDNMTYEQLLARFGDGTENQDRGASAGQIASLPTSTVTNPDDLPNDCRECIVCMENFKRGDVRRTLPCLHSEFHAECVDRWLQSNASCPVCKHQISE